MTFKRTLLATSLLVATHTASAATPSNEEIWQLLQEMKQQISTVQSQNDALQAENDKLKQQVMETQQTARDASEAAEAVAVATEEAVKSVKAAESKTSIGGYGELHYNSLDDQNGSSDKDEMDFHRFVLFFNHEFNDRLRLFSELEVEHTVSGDGKAGAVELEQAYIQYDLNQQHRVSAGLFLMPVGMLNETHEPNTFYGVERNNVEKYILPTTWWEGGAMLSGEVSQGLHYDLAMTSGLKADTTNNYSIRSSRQQVEQADADSFAYTGRVKWTAVPGVELATSLSYQDDMGQKQDSTIGSATLWEAHAAIQRGQFGLKALYARWDIQGNGPKAVGADEQTGWYIEPAYKLTETVGLFSRYSVWDNQAGNSTDTEFSQWDVGVNWWLDPQVVVKFDYQDQDAPASKAELDGINLGIGYQF